MDKPERSSRVYKEINAGISPNNCTEYYEECWISRFIHGEPAEVEERCDYLFSLYQWTGRIILDGYVSQNILKEELGNKQQLVCIDPGMAVRRGSISSDEYWYNKGASHRRFEYRAQMLSTIERFLKAGTDERCKIMFLIFALDFYERRIKPLNDFRINKDHINKYHMLLVGINLYNFYTHKVNECKIDELIAQLTQENPQEAFARCFQSFLHLEDPLASIQAIDHASLNSKGALTIFKPIINDKYVTGHPGKISC